MTKHTQGPWTVETILDQDGDGSSCFPSYGRSREDYILMNPIPTDDDEIAANARLIAAAPELYEQCKLFERVITELMMQGETGGYEELEKLREILAKVDGGVEG